MEGSESLAPREKLMALGPTALSDTELLALFIRTGFKGTTAQQLAAQLLERFGGLRGILELEARHYSDIKGLGPAKATQLQAIMELARRYLSVTYERTQAVHSPDQARTYLQATMRHLPYEAFRVIFLDSQHRVIASEVLFTGTLNQAQVHPREVIRRTLHHNAAAVILAHNHPSGAPEPSSADRQITQTLVSTLKTIDVSVLDHFIVGDGVTVSMAERGMM